MSLAFAVLMAMPALSQTITETHIVTHHDSGPRVAADPDFIAELNGSWSSSETWGDEVPTAGATVLVPEGIAVTYDVQEPVDIQAIEVAGELAFVDGSAMRVGTVQVMPSGSLQVGTAETPIAASVTWLDLPFDLTIDPEQFGIGLHVFGRLEVFGKPKDHRVRLAGGLDSGDDSINLSLAPEGWEPGDRLELPDTALSPKKKKRPEKE